MHRLAPRERCSDGHGLPGLVGTTRRSLITSRDDLIRALNSDAALAGTRFEAVEVAGLEAALARLVPPERSVELWRAARARGAAHFSAILTEDDYLYPEMATVVPIVPLPLGEVRKARERVIASSEDALAALGAIATATPQPEPFDERDAFLDDPASARLSLVLLKGTTAEGVRAFTRDAEGMMPGHAELVTMLQHWNEQYGAEPLYADGQLLELDVRRPPQDVEELRVLARDFFLLSHGTREGFGIEDPARLLRRLMSPRWVVWWYGT